jgi:type I restriction enzyme R subunit
MLNFYIENKRKTIINPLIERLRRLGWSVINSDLYDPGLTLRAGFYQVVLESELKKAVMRINPTIKEESSMEVVRRVVMPKERGLMQINREIYELITKGITLSTDNGEQQRVCVIDFENIKNNSFLVIPFYKVQVLGTGKHFICDVVMFVNGMPLVVIECEPSDVTNAMQRAADRIWSYSNLRGMREGNSWLFYYNQFVVIHDGKNSKYGIFIDRLENYKEWKVNRSKAVGDLPEINADGKSSDLISEMLNPQSLLNIIKNYIIYSNNHDSIEKKIARYYQYYACNNLIDRIINGKDSKEKGGFVYISFGAGKSLTIVFALLKFFNEIGLKDKWTVVVVTEKKEIINLVKQVASLKNMKLAEITNVDTLKNEIGNIDKQIMLVMMNKINERELLQEFPVLSESGNILVMIDEQHRAPYKWISANLQKALPNAVRVVYTGAPMDIIATGFDPFIYRYSLKEAMDDKIIVDILYESRVELIEDMSMQETDRERKEFKDVYAGWSEDEKKKLSEKLFSKRAYLESLDVIKEKARDIIKHYLINAFPNQLKAQVIAYSHLAAVRYKQELDKAIAEAIEFYSSNKNPYIDINRLKRLKVAALITKSVTDPPAYRPYTDENEHYKNITSFLTPFGHEVQGINGDVGIIVVTDLFITGFHAPLEQIIYIDQILKDHNLLQAISRINYPLRNKTAGIVVDYVGFLLHQKEALAAFSEKDQEIIMQSWRSVMSDLDFLKWSDKRLMDFFKEQGILYIEDIEACMNVLSEQNVRSEFYKLYKDFAKFMERLMPRPEALDYAENFKIMTFIAYNARLRYYDRYLKLDDLSDKLKLMLRDFLEAKKINFLDEPPGLLTDNFKELLNHSKHLKSKVKQIESAFYEYVDKHFMKDPAFYEKLLGTIDKLKNDNKDNWELLLKEYNYIIDKIKNINKEENYGFDPENEKPYFSLLMKEIFGVYDNNLLNDEQIQFLITLTRKIIDAIKKETASAAFWHNIGAQKKLKAILLGLLLSISVKKIKAKRSNNAIAQQLLELTWYIHNK